MRLSKTKEHQCYDVMINLVDSATVLLLFFYVSFFLFKLVCACRALASAVPLVHQKKGRRAMPRPSP